MNPVHLAVVFLVSIQWAVLVYFVMVNGLYIVLLVSAFLELRAHMHRTRFESSWRILGSRAAPRISMLAPAHNEEATITESIRSLLSLHYPNLEVVVINDGSTDSTVDVLRNSFDLVPIHTIFWRRIETKPVRALYRSRLYPGLVLVDKENGGKADALNVGLNVAAGDLVCAIDADTLIEADALLRIVRPFLVNEDVLAAGGTIRLVNQSVVEGGRLRDTMTPRRPVAGIQVIEYLRAFLFGRLGWNRLGGNLIISGAFGLFRRDAVIEAGGYVHDTVGEDMELVLRLRRLGYERHGPNRVAFIPDPVAWTEAPPNLKILGRQRDRWHRGLADVLLRHRKILFNPRYGAMGLLVYPYFFCVELLAPVVEAIGLFCLVIGLLIGAVNVPFALLFLALAYGLGVVLSTMTLVLEEYAYHRYTGIANRLFLLLWILVENFGYRQLTVFWRLKGLWRYMRKVKSWGTMERRGFATSPHTPLPPPGDSIHADGAEVTM